MPTFLVGFIAAAFITLVLIRLAKRQVAALGAELSGVQHMDLPVMPRTRCIDILPAVLVSALIVLSQSPAVGHNAR